MRKINLWIGLVAIIFTITSCDEMGDLFGGSNKPGDINLKFTDKPVEQVKQQLESEGIEFMDELMSLQETRLFPVLEYAFELFRIDEEQTYTAALRSLTYELKKSPAQAGFNFQKQMRVKTEDNDMPWGHYEYDFETNEIAKTGDAQNEITIKFPSSPEKTTNNGKLRFNYAESDVLMPWAEEEQDGQMYYPSNTFLVIEVDNEELFYADVKGSYFKDGTPQNIRQSLKMDDFDWETEFKNTGKKITENLNFRKGKKRLVYSEAVIMGNFSREIIDRDFGSDKDYPDETFDSFSAMASVMDIGMSGSFKDFKGFFETIRGLHNNQKLSPEERAEKEAETFNKYLNASAYFVKEKKKFADVGFVLHKYKDGYQDYENNQWVEYTNYDLSPVFILNDGSKVDPGEFVTQGFDELISKIEDILEYFVDIEETPPNIIYPETY